jgi:hypothetical protein
MNMTTTRLSPKKREARVQVAKDVLAQIQRRRFLATRGIYVGSLFNKNGDEVGCPNDLCEKPTNKVLRGKSCEVCAIGSLVVARALRAKDTIDVGALDGMRDPLGDLFTDDELGTIEGAFEGSCAGGYRWDFIRDADENLKTIMRNIVRNKGKFKPEEMPGASFSGEKSGFEEDDDYDDGQTYSDDTYSDHNYECTDGLRT